MGRLWFEDDRRFTTICRNTDDGSYGTATASSPCGCLQKRLLAPEEDVWIEWVRCDDHYEPERDDAMILLAAQNRRVLEVTWGRGPGRHPGYAYWLVRAGPQPQPKGKKRRCGRRGRRIR